MPVKVFRPVDAVALKKKGASSGIQSLPISKQAKERLELSTDDAFNSQFPKILCGTVEIIENDTFLFPQKSALEVSFASMDGSFTSRIPVDIRLPTFGLIDPECAEVFASRLIGLLRLDLNSKTKEYTLKCEDDEAKVVSTEAGSGLNSPNRRRSSTGASPYS